MDLEYNEFLKGIMKKHNTDVWNTDCENDPEYGTYDPFKDYTEPTRPAVPVLPVISRRERRAGTPKEPRADIVEKAHGNNRKMNKARKNNRLFLKLAAFEMSLTHKRIMAR